MVTSTIHATTEDTFAVLGVCQGDCDNDNECEGDLKCFQRVGDEIVPGCTGQGSPATDYCFDRSKAPFWLWKRENDLGLDSYGVCEGGCNNDDDCKGGLKCFHRDAQESVPGCAGEGSPGTNYCFKNPEILWELWEHQTTNSRPITSTAASEDPSATTSVSPLAEDALLLSECQGDCDNDMDCEGDLKCFQRISDEAIPGCDGEGSPGTDYCFDRLKDPFLLWEDGNDLGPNSYGLCEGDCDTDDDCKGDLKCFHRDAQEPVPGCTGEGSPGTDYCFYRLEQLEFVLDTGSDIMGSDSFGGEP